MPVITSALFARFASRQDESPAMKVVAALRNQFGGHAVGKEGSTAPSRSADWRIRGLVRRGRRASAVIA